MALPKNTAEFKRQAPRYIASLMADFKLTDFQAAGFPGNFGLESAGFTKMQEIKPLGGGRGGLGPGQWTADRRVTYEAWLKRKGNAQPGTFEIDYGYLFRELKGPEKGVITPLRNAKTVEEAVEVVMRVFERPGVKALAKRIEWGKLALDTYRAAPVSADVAKQAPAPPPIVDTAQPQLQPTSWWQRALGLKPPATGLVGTNKGDPVLFKAQNQLLAAGYTAVGDPDGLWGTGTNAAVSAALQEQFPAVPAPKGWPLPDAVLASLSKLKRREVSEDRANLRARDMVASGSTVTKGPLATIGTGGLLGMFGIGDAINKSGALDRISKVTDQASTAISTVQSGLTTIGSVSEFVVHYRWLFCVVGALWFGAKGYRWLLETRNLARFGAIHQTTL